MIYKSAKELAKSILQGEYSSESLTESYLERIEKYNSEINAIVISDTKGALERAKGLDKDLAEGKVAGRLHGVPITVKEALNIKGQKTTVNFSQLKNNVASEDSYYVTQLLAAGAVILGKTNVPTMLSDTQTFGPLYPTANNPFNLSKVPGGSTGGGAAAVAAGLTTFEIGSDIGGSIRNPAHYCGLFGLKPTENNHPQDGHVPPLPGSKSGFLAMSSIGPLARTVEDIELAWSIIGKPRWDYLKMLPVNSKLKNRDKISDYKIGWYNSIGPVQCGKETQGILDNFIDKLSLSGVKVSEIKLENDWVDDVLEIWASLFGTIMGQDASWPIRQILKLQFTAMGKGSRLNLVKHIKKGLDLNFKYFSKTLRKRQERLADLNKLFDQYDFIISPTSAGPAFDHNHKHKPIQIDGKGMAYLDYCFTFVMPYNAMGNPVMEVPAGQSHDGLPIGLQIAGPHYSEQQLIHFTKMIEALGFKFKAPPNYCN